MESELKLSTLMQSLQDFCVNVGELGGESKLISSELVVDVVVVASEP